MRKEYSEIISLMFLGEIIAGKIQTCSVSKNWEYFNKVEVNNRIHFRCNSVKHYLTSPRNAHKSGKIKNISEIINLLVILPTINLFQRTALVIWYHSLANWQGPSKWKLYINYKYLIC